ncbi:MAG: hypothetical protein RLZZ396_2554, partial [Planctomycetota bacterium]
LRSIATSSQSTIQPPIATDQLNILHDVRPGLDVQFRLEILLKPPENAGNLTLRTWFVNNSRFS